MMMVSDLLHTSVLSTTAVGNMPNVFSTTIPTNLVSVLWDSNILTMIVATLMSVKQVPISVVVVSVSISKAPIDATLLSMSYGPLMEQNLTSVMSIELKQILESKSNILK